MLDVEARGAVPAEIGRPSPRRSPRTSRRFLQGGHAFPKACRGTRRTLVPTISYSREETKRALAACKARGVSIANAVFALSSLAFIPSAEPERLTSTLPLMMYSALNVRPYPKQGEAPSDWYHIAIGYYKYVPASAAAKRPTAP